MAHEIFHSIQFRYSFTDLKPWFGECTATWMGACVFPYTGEEMRFYNTPGFNSQNPLNHPEYPMDWGEGGWDEEQNSLYKYANFIFAKFLVEWQNSTTIIREIFEYLSNPLIDDIPQAIDLTLQYLYNSNYSEAIIIFAEWK